MTVANMAAAHGATPRRFSGQLSKRTVVTLVGLAVVVAWPWLLHPSLAYVNDATRASLYALVAVSLVLLTGWVGQISLAQGSFVGVSAFTTALVFRKFGIPFPFSLPIAIAASSGAAVVLGVVALRVRGLYLAVATLIFAWMADQFLFPAPWFIGEGGAAVLPTETLSGRPGSLYALDLHDPRIFYVLALATLAVALYAAANLRDSKTGRAFFAIRGSEVAAASLGMDVTRYKLLAFGISGAIAGLAGYLQIVFEGSAVPAEFNFLISLFYLSVAVVGGLTSLPGAVVAGIIFSALNELFLRVTALNGYNDLVAGLLLLGVLLAYPGGVAALGNAIVRRAAEVQGRMRRRGEIADDTVVLRVAASELDSAFAEPTSDAAVEQPSLFDEARQEKTALLSPNRRDRSPVLVAERITVRFGGLTAVDDVSLMVCEKEIVGLIGPNGAGKTTLFNAIAGLNEPAAGTVHIFGTDATRMGVHERAALGVGRTFQLIQLFPQLNVFDNLLAATHLDNHTGFLQHLAVSERAVLSENASRARVTEIIERLNLGDVAHRTVSGLPFGVLRTVELARALVTGAPFVMLDEPASGLDNAETHRLAETLRELRRDLGITILLIEHDVPMVTGVSDYMYVVNRGRLLAQGSPDEVQRNQDVIAAYLGESATEQAAVGVGA
jgi:branched-chain amino acid transport system permease protein